jgi:hypothetical protein
MTMSALERSILIELPTRARQAPHIILHTIPYVAMQLTHGHMKSIPGKLLQDLSEIRCSHDVAMADEQVVLLVTRFVVRINLRRQEVGSWIEDKNQINQEPSDCRANPSDKKLDTVLDMAHFEVSCDDGDDAIYGIHPSITIEVSSLEAVPRTAPAHVETTSKSTDSTKLSRS